MSETLFIRLGSQEYNPIQWLIWSTQQNEVIASGDLNQASDLSHLTEKASQRNVVAFVQASDVALKRLKVPGKSMRSIKAAAPYMLEDELAQDVESLFFAYANLPKDKNDNNCFVAVVEREQLIRWTSWLSAANINCKTLIPDVLALPFNEGNWSAITLNDQTLVRQDVWQGLVVEDNLWALMSEQWRNKNDILESSSDDSTDIDDERDSHEDAEISINAYSPLPETTGLNIQSMPEELPLALLAQHVDIKFFNLLQDEFTVKVKRSANISHWLWVAGIAGIALLTSVAYKGAELIKLNNEITAIETQVIDLYKDAFPKTKNVRIATIKSQLNRKLSEVGSSSSQASFLTMLNSVQPAFSEVSALKPDSMKFDAKRNELRIQAISNNYQSFEQFKNALESKSLTVSQGAQNNLGEQVSGSFTISAKGSR